jgi:hypothetical protein
MERIALPNGRWFDMDSARVWANDSYWDGRNRCSKITGSQWSHQYLYRSKSGAWILRDTSSWESVQDVYEVIDEETALDWLVSQGYADTDDLPADVRERLVARAIDLEI